MGIGKRSICNGNDTICVIQIDNCIVNMNAKWSNDVKISWSYLMHQSIMEFKDQNMTGLRSTDSDLEFLASLMFALRQAVERGKNLS